MGKKSSIFLRKRKTNNKKRSTNSLNTNSKLLYLGLCSGHISKVHRFLRTRTICDDGTQHRANVHRHCRNCWVRPNNFRWRHPVAVHGYPVAAGRCHHFPTNHFGHDRLTVPIFVIRPSRTIRWQPMVVNLADHILWNRTDAHLSKCILPTREFEEIIQNN